MMKVELHSDFWVPHAHTLTARLTEIRSHKRTVRTLNLSRISSFAIHQATVNFLRQTEIQRKLSVQYQK